MRYRYYFCYMGKNIEDKFKDYLETRKIKYKTRIVTGKMAHLSSIVFNIYSSDKNYEVYLEELRKISPKEPIIFKEYSEADRTKAELLEITSGKQYMSITNDQEAYRYYCTYIISPHEITGRHYEQIGELAVKKEPPITKRTAFWYEDTGFAELFTDYRVCEIVRENSLTGIEFKNVILRNGQYSEKIFQMLSPNILGSECIRLGYGEKKSRCPICGKEQYFMYNTSQLHLDFSKIKKQSDFYMTEKIWGEGMTYPLYVISQRFYQLLKKNKLTGNIDFVPVVNVSDKN